MWIMNYFAKLMRSDNRIKGFAVKSGHIYFRGPCGYTINLWLCCGGWRCDADPRWK